MASQCFFLYDFLTSVTLSVKSMSIVRNALSNAFLTFASLRADSSLRALLSFLLFWFGEVPVVGCEMP